MQKIGGSYKKSMRLGNFRDHVKYNERSFEQSMCISFEATDPHNTLICFDVRSPQGSVVLTDPTLEVVIGLTVLDPLDGAVV
jgi:hypothetical protein